MNIEENDNEEQTTSEKSKNFLVLMDFVVMPKQWDKMPTISVNTGNFGSETPISLSKWGIFSETTKSIRIREFQIPRNIFEGWWVCWNNFWPHPRLEHNIAGFYAYSIRGFDH